MGQEGLKDERSIGWRTSYWKTNGKHMTPILGGRLVDDTPESWIKHEQPTLADAT